jgi:uncharacterized membrane protein YgaE (UPF0421/DUF939 family)
MSSALTDTLKKAMGKALQHAPKMATARAWKNALKMALAVALAWWVHDLMRLAFKAWSLPDWMSFADPSRRAWTILTAVVVMQSNLGSSFQASGTRLVGTGVGALIGATAASVGILLGASANVLVVGLAVGAASLICTGLGLKASLRLACMTLGLVVVTSLPSERPAGDPWLIGRERFLDSCIGIGAALLTQLLVFPEPAERELRQSLAKALKGCAALLQSAVDAYMLGMCPARERDELLKKVREDRQKNLALLVDLASEPGSLREERRRLVALAADAGDLAESLLALDDSAQALRREE